MAGGGSVFTGRLRWFYSKGGKRTLQVHFGGKWMDTTVYSLPVKGTRPGKWSGWKKR